ncbi:MAG: ClpXP protease specificity-enhancing factor SspB [Pseudomonadota bacterium]
MSDTINYSRLMHRAMRGLIKELLTDVAKRGELPGEHHFFITFDTRQAGVVIAGWLRERYPEEMTVVMQHWFDNLAVHRDAFSVTLNFGDVPEPLLIPFDAVVTFVDPSVEFGLRFEPDEDEPSDTVAESPMVVIDDDENAVAPDRPGDAQVVSLDSFRKP